MANYFEDFDFTDFWEDSGYAKEKYTEEAPGVELIASVEQELGYKLPLYLADEAAQRRVGQGDGLKPGSFAVRDVHILDGRAGAFEPMSRRKTAQGRLCCISYI